MDTYPWIESYLTKLHGFFHKPPHCILIIDEQQFNGEQLAQVMGKTLLCQSPGANACDHCQSCQLFNKGIHPDFQFHPDILKIDQVRDLIAKNHFTPNVSHFKINFLGKIDSYNEYALNALLKTLEEPSKHSIFILGSTHKRAVKPTILSRAQIINAPLASHQQSKAYLIEKGFSEAEVDTLLATYHNNPFASEQETSANYFSYFNAILDFLTEKKLKLLNDIENMDKAEVIQVLSLNLEQIIHIQSYQNTAISSLNTSKNKDRIKKLSPYAISKLYANINALRDDNVQQININLACKKILLEFIQQKETTL